MVSIKDSDKEKIITLSVSNPHAQDNETELIPIHLGNGLLKSIEYVNTGSTLGVKARIHIDDNGKVKIVAEKMTFINTKRDEDDE
ncbi:MAG: hypothetical protein K9L74_01860 [Candidatus Izimaplasma sp.]|nr:hypothetical protein [Candidatus Izimaplasma bacterium]